MCVCKTRLGESTDVTYVPALILTGCGVSLCLMLVTSVSFSSSVSNVHSFNTLGSLEERGKEKGGRREGEGREKGGRREGEGREKGGRREGEGRKKGGRREKGKRREREGREKGEEREREGRGKGEGREGEGRGKGERREGGPSYDSIPVGIMSQLDLFLSE